MPHTHIWSLVVVSSSVLTGCSSFRGSARSSPEDRALAEALQRIPVEKQEYRISPQDLLSISIYQEEDLKRDARVSQDGRISFPLVGDVKVGGFTALEAEATLSAGLKRYLVEPHVSLQVKEYHSRKVVVLGEVTKPGSYDIPNDHLLTVVEAIAVAGGLTKVAAADRTRVVRRTAGKAENYVVPVKQVTEGDKAKDLALQPDDVVYVPQTLF